MQYASLIPAAVSVFSSLFGGNKAPSNPYLPQMQSELTSEGKQASNLTALGNQANNTYNTFSPQANQATQAEADYLAQNPYTNVVNEALVNRATAGTTAAYQQARAQLAAQNAARGFGGAPSGLLTGGNAAIDAAEANTLGTANNEMAMNEIADLGNRMSQRTDLLTNAANQGFTGASNAYGNAGRMYGDVADTYAQAGQQQEADQMTQQEQQGQMLSSLGEGLGMAFAPQPKANNQADPVMAFLQKIYGQNGQNGTVPRIAPPSGGTPYFNPSNPYNLNIPGLTDQIYTLTR